jgi:hypothetical protein
MKPKHLSEGQLGQGADYRFQRYFVVLPKDHSLEDLLAPTYWGVLVQQKRLNVFDIIRVRAADGSFDTCVTVTSIVTGAAKVELWPRSPENAAALLRPAEAKAAPMDHHGISRVRVEGGDGKYRLLGVNGQEVSGHTSTEEAEGAMSAYLKHLNMRLPSEEESAAHAAEQAEAEAKRQVTAAENKKVKQVRDRSFA